MSGVEKVTKVLSDRVYKLLRKRRAVSIMIKGTVVVLKPRSKYDVTRREIKRLRERIKQLQVERR
jgi:hypothetical protein